MRHQQRNCIVNNCNCVYKDILAYSDATRIYGGSLHLILPLYKPCFTIVYRVMTLLGNACNQLKVNTKLRRINAIKKVVNYIIKHRNVINDSTGIEGLHGVMLRPLGTLRRSCTVMLSEIEDTRERSTEPERQAMDKLDKRLRVLTEFTRDYRHHVYVTEDVISGFIGIGPSMIVKHFLYGDR
jgi:hypothetical protein